MLLLLLDLWYDETNNNIHEQKCIRKELNIINGGGGGAKLVEISFDMLHHDLLRLNTELSGLSTSSNCLDLDQLMEKLKVKRDRKIYSVIGRI